MMERRNFLSLASVFTFQALFRTQATADTGSHPPVRRILFVHGRDQQGIDPAVLRAQWLAALRRGANSLGRQLPDQLDVSFPYYADVLDRYTHGIPTTAEVQTRGDDQSDEGFLAFEASVAEQMRQGAGISENSVDEIYGPNPQPRGPENWRWVQAIVRAIDQHGFGMSSDTIEIFMRDVYLYTNHAGVRNQVDHIVSAMLTEEPTIVVGHSLGSVVAYNVLRTDTRRLQVPVLVTIGCPLAIRAIRDQLVPLSFPKPPVGVWSNAFDPRDIVALNPLDAANFPVSPAVTNYNQVKNHTDNRHGIDGYLDDPTVARWILDALG
jgi:pimeloyl-ACP methyl ester carboxylesterase